MTKRNGYIIWMAYTMLAVIGDSLVHCGFSDPINTPANVDHVISSFRIPRIEDNTTTVVANVKKEQRQAFFPSGGLNHFSPLTNLGGFGSMASMGGGFRTMMMGGMLYGLSLIPAVVMALSGSGFPLSNVLSSFGLSKRALPNTSSAKLPLLSEPQTKVLLRMLQNAFKQWNKADERCKELFVCQMYRQVSSNGVSPDLDLFKEALFHLVERGGQKKAGRAAAHLLSEYEHYFVAAKFGMDQGNCEDKYPECNLSLYPKGEVFKKIEKKPKANASSSGDRKTESRKERM